MAAVAAAAACFPFLYLLVSLSWLGYHAMNVLYNQRDHHLIMIIRREKKLYNIFFVLVGEDLN
jgi:hypothetical protein